VEEEYDFVDDFGDVSVRGILDPQRREQDPTEASEEPVDVQVLQALAQGGHSIESSPWSRSSAVDCPTPAEDIYRKLLTREPHPTPSGSRAGSLSPGPTTAAAIAAMLAAHGFDRRGEQATTGHSLELEPPNDNDDDDNNDEGESV